MLLVADVGNSGVKVGAFDGERLVAALRLAPPFPENLRMLLPDPSVRVAALVAVSVNEASLAAFLAGPGEGAIVLGRDLPILVENRYERPSEVGHDRLANAAGAHALAEGSAVVADLGSAVTVDAVAADGAFLGGFIAPGRRAFVLGLATAAPALPRCDGEEPAGGLPRSTAEAIRSGVALGLAGMTSHLILAARREVRAEGGADPEAFVTGGDAELVAEDLAVPASRVPHLTLFGIRELYLRARPGDEEA